MKTGKIPMRMCVGCGQMKPKTELIRVVKTADGTILLDKTGKQNGRGAYVCSDAKCLASAQKARRFERAFQTSVPDETIAALEESLK